MCLQHHPFAVIGWKTQGAYSRNWSFFLTYWMRTTKKVLQHDVLQLGKAEKKQ